MAGFSGFSVQLTTEEGWEAKLQAVSQNTASARRQHSKPCFFSAPIVDHVQFNVGISVCLFPPELGKEKGNLEA